MAYQIGTRNASTVLRLRDGETQLLAGLISRDESSSSNRLPLLGDLPLVGRLFSSNLDNGDRKELVLAITPHIVRNLRQPTASESEIWVGTEAAPKLRPVGGLRPGTPEPVASQKPTDGGGAAPSPTHDVATPPDASGAPAAPAPAALSWSGVHEAHVGATVEMQLVLATSAELRGLPVELRYDPRRLQLIDATAGTLFAQGGAQTSLSKTDDGHGTAHVGVIRNQATGAAGHGPAIALKFNVLSAGDAAIEVTGAKALGLEGLAPSPTLPGPWVLHVQ